MKVNKIFIIDVEKLDEFTGINGRRLSLIVSQLYNLKLMNFFFF